jgi:hypothetical protein
MRERWKNRPGIAYYCGSKFDPIRQARAAKSGRQAGDPENAAQILLDLLNAAKAPLHLVLGTDALHLVRKRIYALGAEPHQWEAVSRSSDYRER